MNWLVVEDALRDRKGHWLEYVTTFVRGLSGLGDEVMVLCARDAEQDIQRQTGAQPVLPRSIWHRMGDGAGALKRYARVPGHGCATFFALRRVFSFQSSVFSKPATHHANSAGRGQSQRPDGTEQRSEDRGQRSVFSKPETRHYLPATQFVPDVIFVPTVLVHHLLGWWMLLKTGSLPKQSKVLLFFPNAPVRLSDHGRAHMASDPTGKLFRWVIRQLGPEVRSGKVVLGVETHAMQRALNEATGVEFTYLPHPVEATPRATRHPLLATPSKPIVYGCYGAARWEKGSDVLQAAIRKVLEGDPDIPAKFVFQWLEDFTDDKGNRASLDPWVKSHSKVEVIGRYFGEGEYARRLAETDVMVLPYRDPYRLRVSRVVIEAMINGMPVIATQGTTLYEQAERNGVVVGCRESDAGSLAEAIRVVTSDGSDLIRLARERASAAAKSFSVEEFRSLLARKLMQDTLTPRQSVLPHE